MSIPAAAFRIFTLFFVLSVTTLGCGDGSDDTTFGPSNQEAEMDGDSSGDSVSDTETETETDTEMETSQTFFFGEGGNLWKPEADPVSSGAGNLVVLFDSMFNPEFDGCQVKKTSGEVAPLICINDQPFTQIPFSCFSNGNRQTWRASFPCEEAAEVLVTCQLGSDSYVFTVSEAARGQVCSRFG